MILVFRVMSGRAVGIAVPSVSMYIAETVSPTYRGTVGCLPALLHAGGVLVSYIIGAFLPWHIVSYICCVPGLLLVISMTFLPESPIHLVRSGDISGAVKSLQWLSGNTVDTAR